MTILLKISIKSINLIKLQKKSEKRKMKTKIKMKPKIKMKKKRKMKTKKNGQRNKLYLF